MINFLIPLHPKLVHFPIALFMTALIFEVLSRLLKRDALYQAAVIVYCFGALLTPVIVYTGLWEQMRIHLNHPVLTQHKSLGLLTMWISWVSLLILWILNRRQPKLFRTAFFVFLMFVNVTTILTAHYGGKMVYEYAVGVTI